MDSAETSLLNLSLILMVVGLIVSFIPFVPGTILLWLIATVTAYLNNFERIPIVAVAIMTVLMILGATNELWMPLLGIRAPGGSCWSSLGAFVGGLVGTFFIPIPIVGTLVGFVLGAALFELARLRELRRALGAGRSALKTFALNYVVQVLMSIGIFAVFVGSLWITGRGA